MSKEYVLFYDTNALLNLGENAFKENFVISQKTLEEIENIKVSASKDPDVKWKARNISRLLDKNYGDYTVIPNTDYIRDIISEFKLQETPDNIILASAYRYNMAYPVLVCSDDLNCKFISRNIFGLKTKGIDELDIVKESKEYTGYKNVVMSEEDMAYFYEHQNENKYNLNINEYIIILNEDNQVTDKMRWDGSMFQPVKVGNLKSNYFGTIKPYCGDVYQQLALNSMITNQITMIKGPAGTGKSYLSLGYLFTQLEKHKIDRVVVFCNTVATANSAKIGFLPGTQTEKLMDSSIGNMLGGKFGDKIAVERLIADGKLMLLPMCDIRGFDTSGMNAGVYITEAQNMDISLMKLALQRIGEDSICIIDGDYNAQVDLFSYAGGNNGMRRMSEVFRGQDFYGEVELRNIYRSKISRVAELM